ncbi:MAG TPA: tRNA preQ1(34) S-adenosylmethionine ribosyltransferase-isomerase QueA [Candidatus Eisenbacteria bacterium]
MRLEDLDYELPRELIAQYPPPRREDARLLVVERAHGSLNDSRVTALAALLREGDVLVVNRTRVRPARLTTLRRPTGGRVVLLFVRPLTDSGTAERWQVLARPERHARAGAVLEADGGALILEVVRSAPGEGPQVRVLHGDLQSTLARAGEVPLPPYIRRPPAAVDRERYQTVFAEVEGAVAAPTAGLHFSRPLLGSLERAGVRMVSLLLHVGPGTFRPVVAADPREHRMDPEYFELSATVAETLRSVRAGGGRVVAVGTTVVRALESACDAHGGQLGAAAGWTRKFILPPYQFQAVDALLTNFHLPRTTLLLLVAAFAGEPLLRSAYRHAVANRYRFYSYGDAMLVL